MISLKDLKINQSCIINRIDLEGTIRRRLLDIGLVPGCQVKCIMKSPLGDPMTYLIKGAMIAIRNDDASKIIITIL